MQIWQLQIMEDHRFSPEDLEVISEEEFEEPEVSCVFFFSPTFGLTEPGPAHSRRAGNKIKFPASKPASVSQLHSQNILITAVKICPRQKLKTVSHRCARKTLEARPGVS